MLQPKLKYSLNQNQADEERIMAAYEQQLLKDNKNFEDRRNRQLMMAQQAKEFQRKQIKDKYEQMQAQREAEKKEAERELKSLTDKQREEKAKEESIKERIRNNQLELFKQMEERLHRSIFEDTMNTVDFKLNTRLINNLTGEAKLPPMKERKPF